MRNIFLPEVTELQQGCIFNGAIADGFGGSRAFGLIITPRCDIAQCKVPTVHYLPIVRFEDWKRHFLTPLSQEERLEKSQTDLNPLLEKHKIPKHIIKKEYKLSDDDLEKCFQNQNVRNAIIEKIKHHWSLQDSEYCCSTISEWSKYQNRITELVDGKIERFLLLEDWNGGSVFS